MSYLNRWPIILIFFFSAGLLACQDESEELFEPLPTETVSKESSIGLYLSRISALDGSVDNIIDGGSCTSIIYPFTVTVNDTTIEVTSEADYDIIEDIIDELDDDTDEVVINFPIKVMLSDHSVVSVNNMDELEELLDECVEEGFDEDIECIDIVYPITFSSYNKLTEKARTTTINNDNELHDFIDEIEDEEIVSLNYPIVLVSSTGEEITVENNQELEDAITLYEDSCDEDDDNDFDDDDVDDTALTNTLKQNIWTIELYDSANMDKTDRYNGFEIAFLDADSLNANANDEFIAGEWDTNGNYGYLELSLDFDTDGNLAVLNREWFVKSFTNEQIEITVQEPDMLIVMRAK